jgi:hypothetical protein
MRRFKVIAPLLVGLALALAGGYVWWRLSAGPLRFDAQRWAAAQSYSDTTRYRMSQDLLNHMRSEHWSLDRTLKELGKPESGTGWEPENGKGAARLLYLLGEKPPKRLNGGFNLVLTFDEKGQLFSADVRAQ